jgi:hypothetical protein
METWKDEEARRRRTRRATAVVVVAWSFIVVCLRCLLGLRHCSAAALCEIVTRVVEKA